MKTVTITYNGTSEDAELAIIEYRLQHPEFHGTVIATTERLLVELRERGEG